MTALSANAITVLEGRYLQKNRKGEMVETPDELFHRVAKAIAKAELVWGSASGANYWEKEFYAMLGNLLFLPNSPTLMNAGTPLNQLSACFVLPVQDSMEGIFTTLKNTALIQQSGGGTGFNFSRLRPKNDFVSTTNGQASGPVSFMKIFDAATENIKQGGKRRGANMGILNIDHPDIEEFIAVKKDKTTLRNFNISVAVTGSFMLAVMKNKDWQLIHPASKNVVRTLKAKKLWNEIINNAWKTGDPGLIFLDAINSRNPTPQIGAIECTNPCGEVPLLAYEPCNLGSINLSKFVNEKKEIDWGNLAQLIAKAIRFLDNVIEVNTYILPEIKQMALGNRKIGLGVMGWAEMLIRLGIPYDSEEAIHLAEKLMKFINQKSFEASVALAEERGVFKNWEKSTYAPGTPVRNATRTSIAPTGTISIIADASSSIEPLFALAFRRQHVLNNQILYETNKLFIDYLKKNKLYSDKLLNSVMKHGSLQKIKKMPPKAKKLFRTSMDIDYTWHIRHQVAFQKYTDNAVSKTINLPEDATVKDVEKAYKLAWRLGAKGITIFRYGSKGVQILNKGMDKSAQVHSVPMSEIQACKVCIE